MNICTTAKSYVTPTGRVWKIEFVPPDSDNLIAHDRRCIGTTNYKSHTIYLSNTLVGAELYSTLCHEMSHACLYDTQIKQEETYDEEYLCDFMGMYGDHIITTAHHIIDAYMEMQNKGLIEERCEMQTI